MNRADRRRQDREAKRDKRASIKRAVAQMLRPKFEKKFYENKKFLIGTDEYVRDGLTVVAAAMVTEENLVNLERDWAELRQRIKDEMQGVYPRATDIFKAQSEYLPEIHAAEIFQSQGIFRIDSPTDKHYWRRHRFWLNEAVKIILKHDVSIFYGGYTSEEAAVFTEILGPPSEGFAKELPYKNVKIKIDALFSSRYAWTLNSTFEVLENFLELNNSTGRIVCDQHDEGRGFSLSSLFRSGTQEPRIGLSTPEFTNSIDTIILQVADVAAYIFGNVSRFTKFGIRKIDPDIALWAKELFPVAYSNNRGTASDRWLVRMIEFCVLHSGGPAAYRANLRPGLTAFLASLNEREFDAEGWQFKLTREGAFFLPYEKE